MCKFWIAHFIGTIIFKVFTPETFHILTQLNELFVFENSAKIIIIIIQYPYDFVVKLCRQQTPTKYTDHGYLTDVVIANHKTDV